MHLTFKQLNYFVEIVEAGNMSQAAEALHVSSTALSQQVRSLEDQLGVTLLERHSRGVAPTANGAELYSKATEIIALVTQTERALTARPRKPAPVRLGVLPSAAQMFGYELVIRAPAALGARAVDLAEDWADNLTEDLLGGKLDYVVARDLQPNEAFEKLDLVEESLVYATAADKERPGGSIDFADAVRGGLIFAGTQSACGVAIVAKARELGLPPRITHRVRSMDVFRQMIRSGVGASITPFGVVADDVAKGRIAAHDIVGANLSQVLSLAARPETFAAGRSDGFVDMLCDLVVAAYSRHGRRARLLIRRNGAGGQAEALMQAGE